MTDLHCGLDPCARGVQSDEVATRRIRVFVASPGDVADERHALEDVVAELNHTLGQSLDLVVELVRWETHASPGFGHDAQDVINAQIPSYDVFLGIMWARLGSPTGRAPSGTVEEFERAYARWRTHGTPRLMFYFRSARFDPDSSDAVAQFESVQHFKQSLTTRGALYWEFADVTEFQRLTRRHLYAYLSQLEVQDTPAVSWRAELTYAKNFHRIIMLSRHHEVFELNFKYRYLVATVKVNGDSVGRSMTVSGPQAGCGFPVVLSGGEAVSGRVVYSVNTLLSKFTTFSVLLDGQCVYSEDNRILNRG